MKKGKEKNCWITFLEKGKRKNMPFPRERMGSRGQVKWLALHFDVDNLWDWKQIDTNVNMLVVGKVWGKCFSDFFLNETSEIISLGLILGKDELEVWEGRHLCECEGWGSVWVGITDLLSDVAETRSLLFPALRVNKLKYCKVLFLPFPSFLKSMTGIFVLFFSSSFTETCYSSPRTVDVYLFYTDVIKDPL